MFWERASRRRAVEAEGHGIFGFLDTAPDGLYIS